MSDNPELHGAYPRKYLGDLGEQAAMRYFCHEDALMWSRLHVMAVVQLATLSAAYYVLESGKSTVLPIIILVVGAVMTILVFLLLKRSEAYRDAIKEKWLRREFHAFNVPRKCDAPLRGKEIAWIIVILSVIADILCVLDVLTRWFGLLS